MIEKGKYYVNRFSVGKFHFYLALEDEEDLNTKAKAVDITDESITYIQIEHVIEVNPESIDKKYLDVASRYL